MVIPLCHIQITNAKTKEFMPDVIPGFIAHCFLMTVTRFCFRLMSLHHILPYLPFLLSFPHSCLPTFLLPFCLTITIYPSLCLILLMSPMSFAIVVAFFIFHSFLPSRRHRDDEHDARCAD